MHKNIKIIETLTRYEKVGKSFKQIEKEVREISQQHYENATSTDTIKFFKRLGGTERISRNYTCAGYLIEKITSISPNRENKTIREYQFIY